MDKVNFYSRGQSLIGIIIVLVVVGLIGGSLYLYLSKQLPEIPEIAEKPAEEEVKPEGVTPLPKEEPPEEEAPPEKERRCTDGTPHNQCSADKPKYCDNGNLIDRCNSCGCPDGLGCVDNKCLQDNVREVIKDVFGSHIRVIASDNPSEYLGNYIFNFPDIEWRTYKPIINKVNELTKGISSNRERAEIIAIWVKHSKKYGFHPLNYTSVSEIFNANNGVCTEAAFLTTAMLRIAGIPAREVFPLGTVWHVYTEAYVDGEWIGIDSTFGTGDPSIIEEPSAVLKTHKRMALPANKVMINVISPSEVNYYVIDSVSKPGIIKKNRLGPGKAGIGSEVIMWSKIKYIKPYFKFKNEPPLVEAASVESEDLECSHYSCFRKLPDGDKTQIGLAFYPRFHGRLLTYKNGILGKETISTFGTQSIVVKKRFLPYSFSTVLPPGKYKFVYQMVGSMDLKTTGPVTVAYIEIDLTAGEEFTINPDILIESSDLQKVKSPKILSGFFSAFIQHLKSAVNK